MKKKQENELKIERDKVEDTLWLVNEANPLNFSFSLSSEWIEYQWDLWL